MSNSLVDLLNEKFEKTAGRAVLFELKVRLLADKTKAISKLSDGFDFDRVYKAVCKEFAAKISTEDQEALKLAKKLRDHVVHAEFQKAFWKLKPDMAGVRVIDVAGLSGEQLLEKITRVQGGLEEAKPVPFAKGAGKFGWLLEASTGSLLDEAYESCTKGIAVIDRISLETALGE